MIEIKSVLDYEEISTGAAKKFIECIKNNPNALVCLAGGDTPIGSYIKFVEMIKEKNIDYSNITFIGLDEWVGVSRDNPGSCYAYLNKYVFSPLNIKEDKIIFFDTNKNLNDEIIRFDKVIEDFGKIDFTILGIGQNGHVGFNEPHIKPQNTIVVNLDDNTKEVGSKYFDGTMEFSKGITLGLNHLYNAKEICFVASGETKREAISKLFSNKLDLSCPVTYFCNHNNAILLTDLKF